MLACTPWLVQLCSVCSLILSRTTGPGWSFPQWAGTAHEIIHSLVKKMYHRLAHKAIQWGHSSQLRFPHLT